MSEITNKNTGEIIHKKLSESTGKKTLLHACCGPCSLEPSRILRESGHDLTIYYANSNINPGEEYTHRLETLKAWAAEEQIPVIEGEYNHEAWHQAVKDTVTNSGTLREGVDRSERCRACYRMRFEEAAEFAAREGYDCLSTTLSVSPYQYTEVIEEELIRAGKLAGVEVEFHDFRPYYDEATRRSREMGMYRQNYCGCEISDKEAAEEREERKAQRKAQHAAKREQFLAEHGEELAAEQKAREESKRAKQEYASKQQRKREILKALRNK